MDVRDREEFDLAVELAKNDQPQAAYFILSRLREKHPQNNRVQVLSALTSPEPIEARTVFEAAIRLDPADPILTQAIEWLEKRPDENTGVRPDSPDTDHVQTVEKPESNPTTPVTNLNLNEEFTPPVDGTLKSLAATKTENYLGKLKTFLTSFSWLWWLQLAFSLIFFGSALGLLFILVTSKNLNEAEKAYSQGVGQLTRKTGEVNSQLQTAISEFNVGKLSRADLEKQLQDVIGLNDDLRQLKSPSPRFDKLDGLLGEAFSYFNDGATNLINGLESGSVDQFNEGYRLFGLGNDYLRQARDELKALGG